MGAPEEAGKVAHTVVEALKTTPVILAILIFNVLYVALNAWQTIDARAGFRQLMADMIRNCGSFKPSPSSSVVFKPLESPLLSLDPTSRDPSKPR